LIRFLYQQFLYIVGQLVDVCTEINQTAVQDVKDKLPNLEISNEDVHKIFAILTSQTKDTATAELFTDAEKCLSNVIVLYEQCLLEKPHNLQTDLCSDLQYTLACEKIKTYLSLAQLLLYGPISPVDYVMCDTVKHDCLQRVVRDVVLYSACMCVYACVYVCHKFIYIFVIPRSTRRNVFCLLMTIITDQ